MVPKGTGILSQTPEPLIATGALTLTDSTLFLSFAGHYGRGFLVSRRESGIEPDLH